MYVYVCVRDLRASQVEHGFKRFVAAPLTLTASDPASFMFVCRGWRCATWFFGCQVSGPCQVPIVDKTVWNVCSGELQGGIPGGLVWILKSS